MLSYLSLQNGLLHPQLLPGLRHNSKPGVLSKKKSQRRENSDWPKRLQRKRQRREQRQSSRANSLKKLGTSEKSPKTELTRLRTWRELPERAPSSRET